jgi:hypothetical protein
MKINCVFDWKDDDVEPTLKCDIAVPCPLCKSSESVCTDSVPSVRRSWMYGVIPGRDLIAVIISFLLNPV